MVVAVEPTTERETRIDARSAAVGRSQVRTIAPSRAFALALADRSGCREVGSRSLLAGLEDRQRHRSLRLVAGAVPGRDDDLRDSDRQLVGKGRRAQARAGDAVARRDSLEVVDDGGIGARDAGGVGRGERRVGRVDRGRRRVPDGDVERERALVADGIGGGAGHGRLPEREGRPGGRGAGDRAREQRPAVSRPSPTP